MLAREEETALLCYETELNRIQKKLMQFLSSQEAQLVANRICTLVAEVDEEINRILSDPLVEQLYEYDGKFFTSRGTQLFHRAFNGLNVLQSLSDAMLETYFGSRRKNEATEWLMDSLGTHIWEAKVRRLNWEDSGTLCCITDEVIDEILRQTREPRGIAEEEPSRLSAEEEAFFKPYEDDISALHPALRQR